MGLSGSAGGRYLANGTCVLYAQILFIYYTREICPCVCVANVYSENILPVCVFVRARRVFLTNLL
jgi:hypothetical protein